MQNYNCGQPTKVRYLTPTHFKKKTINMAVDGQKEFNLPKLRQRSQSPYPSPNTSSETGDNSSLHHGHKATGRVMR